jgi:hypothetical protein
MPSITRATQRMFMRMANFCGLTRFYFGQNRQVRSAPRCDGTERHRRPCRRGGYGLSGREEWRSIASRSRSEELERVVTVVDEEDAMTVRRKSQPEEIAAGTGRIDLR